jgi:glycosyltransferase involved in cell wall biosynthesis
MDNRKISLALTTYNRIDDTLLSFNQLLNDDRISEIVINDDFSDIDIFENLKEKIKSLNSEKIKLLRNIENMGVSRNKKEAISLCNNDWVIIFDSDNIIDKSYIDKLYEEEIWYDDVIYCPDEAGPFNYKFLGNLKLDKNDVIDRLNNSMMNCFLNTCNYFVNKQKYVEVYEYEDILDTMNFCYLWLKRNYFLRVVENMHYIHRQRPDSDYMKYEHIYEKHIPIILEKIKKLKS